MGAPPSCMASTEPRWPLMGWRGAPHTTGSRVTGGRPRVSHTRVTAPASQVDVHACPTLGSRLPHHRWMVHALQKHTNSSSPESRAQGGRGGHKLLPRALGWTDDWTPSSLPASELTPGLRTRAQGRPRWAPRPARGLLVSARGLTACPGQSLGRGDGRPCQQSHPRTARPSPCTPGGREEKLVQTWVFQGHDPAPIISLPSHRRKADELTPLNKGRVSHTLPVISNTTRPPSIPAFQFTPVLSTQSFLSAFSVAMVAL